MQPCLILYFASDPAWHDGQLLTLSRKNLPRFNKLAHRKPSFRTIAFSVKLSIPIRRFRKGWSAPRRRVRGIVIALLNVSEKIVRHYSPKMDEGRLSCRPRAVGLQESESITDRA